MLYGRDLFGVRVPAVVVRRETGTQFWSRSRYLKKWDLLGSCNFFFN